MGVKGRNGITGATLVETVIALPVVLVCIYLIITVSVLVHARSSLSTAMTQALRLATTRGDRGLVGAQLIDNVDTFQGGSSVTLSGSGLDQFISTGVRPSDAESFLDNCFVKSGYPSYDSRTVPRQYLFTLIYMKEALQQSLGASLKFPCRPTGTTSRGTCNLTPSAGCVGCYLVPQSGAPDPDRFQIRCEYAPASVFIDPLIKLFSLFGGVGSSSPLTIDRELVFEVTRLGE